VSVIDAKANVAVVSLSLVAAATGVSAERNAATESRIIQVEDITDDIVEFFLGVNPGAQSKVAGAELEGSVARNFDIRAPAVERAAVEVDPVIYAVVAVAGIVAAIALELPIAHQPWFPG
jgi:hypothetical protein